MSCFESSVQDAAQLRVRRNVREHSKCVTVDRKLKWPVVERLLYSLEDLKGIRLVDQLCQAYLTDLLPS